MATIKYDAVATLRRTDKNSGEEKKSYHKMGVVFETAKGLSLKVESIPVGWDGWVSLYPPKEKAESKPLPQAAPTRDPKNFSDMVDDIPF